MNQVTWMGNEKRVTRLFIFLFQALMEQLIRNTMNPYNRFMRRRQFFFLLLSHGLVPGHDWVSLMLISILLCIRFFSTMQYFLIFTLQTLFLIFKHQWICQTACFICIILDWFFYWLELFFVIVSLHCKLLVSSCRLGIILHTSCIHIYIFNIYLLFAEMLI